MLREIFYGAENPELVKQFKLTDANPREAFIALCLLVPIIAIGVYPKLATQTYDAKAVQIAAQAQTGLSVIADHPFHLTPSLFAPSVIGVEAGELSGIVK
jgi:NAD(P)H-quinone oxidoreductase subunit 4